jgi:exosortase
MNSVKLALLVVLFTGVYVDVVWNLVNQWWTDPAASHGLLIPPLAGYIAWMKRQKILEQSPVPEVSGLWLICAAATLLLAGYAAADLFLPRISLVIMLAGLTMTFWGSARLRGLVFPLLLLLTMIPLPVTIFNALAGPLQLFASDVSTEVARFLGIAIHRDGNIIRLAHITLGVADACSGLHSLSTLLVASLLLGFIHLPKPGGRLGLLLIAAPLAIGVNVFRVTGTAVLADIRPELALGFYHSFSGWAVFLVGFAGLWVAARTLSRLFG